MYADLKNKNIVPYYGILCSGPIFFVTVQYRTEISRQKIQKPTHNTVRTYIRAYQNRIYFFTVKLFI